MMMDTTGSGVRCAGAAATRLLAGAEDGCRPAVLVKLRHQL